MSSGNPFDRPKQIAAEQELLDTIQGWHAMRLTEMGVIQKAVARECHVYPPDRAERLANFYKDNAALKLALMGGEYRQGEQLKHPCIVLEYPQRGRARNVYTARKSISMGTILGNDEIIPRYRSVFEPGEVKEVVAMLEGLKQLKEAGILSYLSADLSSIHNPSTAIMAKPLPKIN